MALIGATGLPGRSFAVGCTHIPDREVGRSRIGFTNHSHLNLVHILPPFLQAGDHNVGVNRRNVVDLGRFSVSGSLHIL